MNFKFFIATFLAFTLTGQLLVAQRLARSFGGPGGPTEETIELVDKFDQNENGRLETNERKAALKHLKSRKGSGQSRRMPRHRGPAGKPGRKIAIASVKPIANDDLYDTGVLRTVF